MAWFCDNDLFLVVRYMAPMQGVVSVEGGAVAPGHVQVDHSFSYMLFFINHPFFVVSIPFVNLFRPCLCFYILQPLFSQPRPKRCATHCHIARNIHYLQQFMKMNQMNPFWPAPAASASLFGSKPCNLNVIPGLELHGNVAVRGVSSTQDKNQSLPTITNHVGKEKSSQLQSATSDSSQRKQQIIIQQALPPVAPSNLLVCFLSSLLPTTFFFCNNLDIEFLIDECLD